MAKVKSTRRGEAKRSGRFAAKEWLKTADLVAIVQVAGCQFVCDEDTLCDLADEGLSVPRSADLYYSWGFYTAVKSHVVHQLNLWKQRTKQRAITAK